MDHVTQKHSNLITNTMPPDQPIIVYVENAWNPELGGITIPLPATTEQLNKCLTKIGAYGRGNKAIGVYDIRSAVPGLVEKMPLEVTLDDLDYLAALITLMDDVEYRDFIAALENVSFRGGIDEILLLADVEAD